jgi:hypothetical protein
MSGTASTFYFNSIKSDYNGGVVVSAYTSASAGTIFIGDSSGALSTYGTAPGNIAGVVAKLNSSTGAPVWLQQINGSSSDYATGVNCDRQGNAYVVGYLNQSATTITVANMTYNNILSTTGQNQALAAGFVAKLSSATGNAMWFQRIDGTGSDYGYTSAVDTFGDVYVTGAMNQSTSTITVANMTYNNILSTTGQNQALTAGFVAKLGSATGDAIWFQRIDGSNSDNAYAIAVDSNINVYVTGQLGQSTSTITVGDISFNNILSSTGQNQVGGAGFVAKLSGYTGNGEWLQRIDFTGADSGHAIAVDSSDNLYLTGVITGISGETTTFDNDLKITKKVGSTSNS